MILTEPQPFREAIESRQIRQLLPTELRTELLAVIAPELRERAMVSAGVVQAEFLQEASDSIDEILAGTSDRATQRAKLKELVARLGIRPAEGEEGTLTDLSSDARLNLILDTNLEMAQGYGSWIQGQDPAILDLWPAQELVRVREAKEPRDWAQRWADAGGTFYGTRMIARKDDPIWTRISRFGLPYPPFDFNSGMDVQDVDRETAIAAGVIDADEQVRPQSRDFNTDLQASPEVRSDALREALAETLQGIASFDAEGVLRIQK